MSSRRGVVLPDPWPLAEESELREQDAGVQQKSWWTCIHGYKRGLMKGIRCVCGSYASPESIAPLSVYSPEAESTAIEASLHEVLLRTTAPLRMGQQLQG